MYFRAVTSKAGMCVKGYSEASRYTFKEWVVIRG